MSKTSRPVRVGNIRQISGYNPFPKDGGLVSQYEPFIRKRVGHYYELYPHVSYDDLLSEAVRLAVHAAELFKPELGNHFSTYLGPHLKGLHRFAQSQLMQLPQPKDEPSLRRLASRYVPSNSVVVQTAHGLLSTDSGYPARSRGSLHGSNDTGLSWAFSSLQPTRITRGACTNEYPRT